MTNKIRKNDLYQKRLDFAKMQILYDTSPDSCTYCNFYGSCSSICWLFAGFGINKTGDVPECKSTDFTRYLLKEI